MVGLLGVVIGSGLYGKMADSRFGWRGMYFIGIAPLLLVAFLRRNIRETQRFQVLAKTRDASPGILREVSNIFAQAVKPLFGPSWRRVLLVAVLWNSVNLVGSPAVTFFTLYAKRDRHWTSKQVGWAVGISYMIGTLGHLAAGWMLDRIGRRFTNILLYLIGAASIFALFKLESYWAMLLAQILTVCAFQGARTATGTYSAELFPTEIRATSYSLTVQLFGSLAAVLTPFLIGWLSMKVGGLGNAVAIMSVGPVIGAAAVLLFAPETRAIRLEEIGAAAVAD
jgi:putative MFS transporter